MKIFKKKLISATKHIFIFIFITAWVFSPWAQVNFQFKFGDKNINVALIPEIQEAQAATTTHIYNSTTTATTFVVPTGVTSITVKAWGAGGGGGGGGSSNSNPGGNGGAGGYTTADIPVTAGESLTVIVGGGGGGGGNDEGSGADDGAGGGGGGFSAILRSATFLIAAGGGGGGGSASAAGTEDAGAGGGGGGTATSTDGDNGLDAGCTGASGGVGGGGKGATYLGVGREGGGCSTGADGSAGSGNGGGAGAASGATSAGGSGGSSDGSTTGGAGGGSASTIPGAGGGGGGYYGGGGGEISNAGEGSGGGGGGVGYSDASNTNVASSTAGVTVTPPNTADSDYGTVGGVTATYNSATGGTGGPVDLAGQGGQPGRIVIIHNIPVRVSGTIYTDEGTTALNSAGKTVSLRVNGTTYSTTTISGTGLYELWVPSADINGNGTETTFLSGVATGTPVLVWVDGDSSFRASTLTVASSTVATSSLGSLNHIPSVDLYQNRVIIKHEGESATSTTIAKLGLYDGDDDEDIQFSVDGSNNLSVKAGTMLYIWPGTELSATAESGGTITLHGGVSGGPDGDLKFGYGAHPAAPGISTSSILSLNGNALSLAGSWYATSSGAVLNSTGTVTLSATTTGRSIYATSTPFYNLTFDGVDGTAGGWTFQENASTTNNFTITDGTVVAPSWLSIAGNFTNNGTFTSGTGTTTLTVGTTQTISGTLTGSSGFNNVEINPTGGWPYRKKITLKQASTTLTAFPALISLSDADLAARAQSNGNDILFTSSDGFTRLSHEIENYASGGMNAWVKIPTLSSTAATDIYMYYGNSTVGPQETPTTVWNGSYEAVWHMSEDPTGVAPQILDSTANNNDGTVSGTWIADDQTLSSTTASGAIGGSLYFTGLKTLDYIDAGAGSSVDLVNTLTASIWVKGGGQEQDTFAQMFGKVLADNTGWGIDTATAGPTTRVRVDTSGGVGQTQNFGTALDNTWRRLTVILDSGNIDLFLNQNQTIDSTYTHGTGLSTVQPVNMGRRSNNSNYYEGFLDEARIASTTLSADWLAIEYDNISATTTFYTSIGSEETNTTTWNFEVPSGRSVSYVNVKDSNACYTAGNNISTSNSTDGGGNSCWTFPAPANPGTLTLASHDAGQESDKFNTSSLDDAELFAFKLTPTNESITTILTFNIDVFGDIQQADITDIQLFPDYDSSGSVDTDDAEDPLGGSGTISLTGNKGTIVFSSFSTSTAMNYMLRADVADINYGSSFLINLIVGRITATGDTSSQSITPTGTVLFVDHDRIDTGSIGGGPATGEVLGEQAEQTGASEGNKGGNKTKDDDGAPAVLDEDGGNEGAGGRSELPEVFMRFASIIKSLNNNFINVFSKVL